MTVAYPPSPPVGPPAPADRIPTPTTVATTLPPWEPTEPLPATGASMTPAIVILAVVLAFGGLMFWVSSKLPDPERKADPR